MTVAETVLDYWFTVLGPKGWYAGGAEIDDAIRSRFLPLWEEAAEGGLGLWLTSPEETLAYLIVTDQFPRNMFRNEARAFSTDAAARAAAKAAIDRDWDMAMPAARREFFYLPLMHSESLVDQDRSVRLIGERLPDQPDTLLHARAHREVIRLFGRFPYRNAALERPTSPVEAEWIAAGGYGALVREMKA